MTATFRASLLAFALAFTAHAQTIKALPPLPCFPGPSLTPCQTQYRLTLQTPANPAVTEVRYTVTAILAATGQAFTVTGTIPRPSPRASLFAVFGLPGASDQFTVRVDELVVSATSIATVEVSK